jgi:pyruvate/2-oxoglutarate dehydrogenase complex dihydrolipoamide acyltransferase (E2) component
VRKARNNKLAVTDFQGTTISLTNRARSAPTTPCRG